MRAGKLRTKQYKIRRGGRGWLGWLTAALVLALGTGALYAGLLPWPGPEVALAPSPTLTPQDSAAETRLIALPGGAWYALQMGAFDQASSAQSLADSYRGRGAAGWIWQEENYRVLAAAYESRADAQAVQSQLKAQHGVETVVADLIWPDITLRVTGQKAQLDALSDAYDALDQMAKHLCALSQALDRGETDQEALRSALLSQRDTAAALENRLSALFSPGLHPAVEQGAALLGSEAQGLVAALAASGSARMGAQIKYCHLMCVCGLMAHAQALAP